MGFGYCRFEGCEEGTNIDYNLSLQDQDVELLICGLWEHYATEHNVLPPERVREVVMSADPELATSHMVAPLAGERFEIYFVEREGEGFNHKIGEEPDTEFIDKLKEIIDEVEDSAVRYYNN